MRSRSGRQQAKEKTGNTTVIIGHISFDISHLSFPEEPQCGPVVGDSKLKTRLATQMTTEKCQMIYDQ